MNRVFIRDIKLGESNVVSGFVENIRNKKSMAFIVLKDITGKLQLTIEKSNVSDAYRLVDTLCILFTNPLRLDKELIVNP